MFVQPSWSINAEHLSVSNGLFGVLKMFNTLLSIVFQRALLVFTGGAAGLHINTVITIICLISFYYEKDCNNLQFETINILQPCVLNAMALLTGL